MCLHYSCVAYLTDYLLPILTSWPTFSPLPSQTPPLYQALNSYYALNELAPILSNGCELVTRPVVHL